MATTYRWYDAAQATVARSRDGALIPADLRNADYAELIASGVTIDAYQAPPILIEHVKNEARRRILARYPDWKQANMTARAVELVNTRHDRGWSPEEATEAGALQVAWDWVKSARVASDAIEAISPIPADFAADKHWPE